MSNVRPQESHLVECDKNVSPVGWYIGSYLLRFVELGDGTLDDPEARFLSWENTVMVKANSLDAAYGKVAAIGKGATKPYRGGPMGVRVKWKFVGITELLPIYYEPGDGAELMWAERSPRKLKTLLGCVRPKGSFRQ